ncbi:PRELI domain-containing protein 1, mitochondrial [Sciurus carolinensis]|uniref:PRELI domain-containing protein 1, mitochondrial n=1 Tax=Sciurus carolinensis TaxID=30640 RepID=A0AA41NDX8_SCICA|nr:PRELI domain-containing protein 1, mitochondrial [Sciurus carolinensis]
MTRWAEQLFPANVAHSVYILEDSVVDPQNQTMTTFTWNINHARLMAVEERCVYHVNSDNSGWTEIRRETWVSSCLFGVSRAVQEFGLTQFKSNGTKTMKGFEYILAKLQEEIEEESETTVEADLTDKQKHQLKHRELFLSLQYESLPAKHIRVPSSLPYLDSSYVDRTGSSAPHRGLQDTGERPRGQGSSRRG